MVLGNTVTEFHWWSEIGGRGDCTESKGMSDFAEVSENALSLNIGERALLAEKLLDSLEDVDEEEWAALWMKEAERRRRQLVEGTAKAIPAAQVHQRIDKLLQQ